MADYSRFTILLAVFGVCIMRYFKQENKDAIHSCSGENCKYPIKNTYVIEDKINDGSVIRGHTDWATEDWFP